jgi:hypothetical protein
MVETVFFARIGWMVKYRGPQPGDEHPIGGGEYTKANLGHEAFNFLPINGCVYAFIQPRGSARTMNLERITGGACGESVDDVLIVFVARHPREGGQRVVGWYRNALVFRNSQTSHHPERRKFEYYAVTKANKATLLPLNRRECETPSGKGGIGQANVCYLYNRDDTLKQMPWVEEALAFVENYKGKNVVQAAIG